jgi:hypothetical protein
LFAYRNITVINRKVRCRSTARRRNKRISVLELQFKATIQSRLATS